MYMGSIHKEKVHMNKFPKTTHFLSIHHFEFFKDIFISQENFERGL